VIQLDARSLYHEDGVFHSALYDLGAMTDAQHDDLIRLILRDAVNGQPVRLTDGTPVGKVISIAPAIEGLDRLCMWTVWDSATLMRLAADANLAIDPVSGAVVLHGDMSG